LAVSGTGLRLSKSMLPHGVPTWGWTEKVGRIDFILNPSLFVSFNDCCIYSGSSGQRVRSAPRLIFSLAPEISSTVPYCNVSGQHEDIHNNANSSVSRFLIVPSKTVEIWYIIWEDNVKMNLQEVGGSCGDCMELAQDMDRWRALVGTVRNLRVQKMRGIS
jgi:hypothetical protein